MLQFHQQIRRGLNAKFNHPNFIHEFDHLQQEIEIVQDIKFQDDYMSLNDLVYEQQNEEQLPNLRVNQEKSSQMDPKVAYYISLQVENYVKAGQNLLFLFRNLPSLKFENKSQTNQFDNVISSQSKEEEKCDLFEKNQVSDICEIKSDHFKRSKPQPLKQKSPQFQSPPPSEPKVEVSQPKPVYKFLPDKELSLQFDDADYQRAGLRKYNVLSEEQIQKLKQDLSLGLFTRSQLTKKYKISNSTLLRYAHRFNYSSGELVNGKPEPFHVIYQRMKEAGHYKTYHVQPKPSKQLNMEVYNKKKADRISRKQASRRYIDGNTPTNIHYRYLFMKQFKKLDIEKVIFIDEVFYWKITSQTSEDGYSNNVGTFMHPDFGFLKQINILIALTNTSLIHWKIKPQKFTCEQVESFLCQITQQLKGYTFIMDNHSTHKNQNFRARLVQKGIAVEYLPPSSAQMNPITSFFKRFKRILMHRLQDAYSTLMLMQQTQKLMKEMQNEGLHQNFFSGALEYWKMAQKKQMFPAE